MPATLSLIDAALLPLADPSRAAGMASYLRDQFPFLGIPAPARRAAVRGLLPRQVDWDLVDACWDRPEREYQYVACDHLRKARLEHGDLPRLRSLVVTKSWWDTVDALAKPVGTVASAKDMRAWAVEEDVWVRRVAILHQLGRKDQTDAGLLGEILAANLDSGEFFIDKAVGWALREYSKTDPAWVRGFLASHEVSVLSRREGSKYL